MKDHFGETPLGCLLGIAAIILAIGITRALVEFASHYHP